MLRHHRRPNNRLRCPLPLRYPNRQGRHNPEGPGAESTNPGGNVPTGTGQDREHAHAAAGRENVARPISGSHQDGMPGRGAGSPDLRLEGTRGRPRGQRHRHARDREEGPRSREGPADRHGGRPRGDGERRTVHDRTDRRRVGAHEGAETAVPTECGTGRGLGALRPDRGERTGTGNARQAGPPARGITHDSNRRANRRGAPDEQGSGAGRVGKRGRCADRYEGDEGGRGV